jgi:pantothenate kinase
MIMNFNDSVESESSRNNLPESIIYNNLITKLSEIKENIEKIHVYTSTNDNNKSLEYLEKLNEISILINNMHAVSTDLLDEYTITLPDNVLSHEEQQKQELLKINKKIYNTFVPYMLYMSILLQNSN